MKPDFIVHDVKDTVGVAVVKTITEPKPLTGWVMENDSTIQIDCKAEIPLGHKVALIDIKSGDTILKYGHDIGKAIGDIPKGGYVHVHNVKTKRW